MTKRQVLEELYQAGLSDGRMTGYEKWRVDRAERELNELEKLDRTMGECPKCNGVGGGVSKTTGFVIDCPDCKGEGKLPVKMMGEEEVWAILAKVHGCKNDKEDCSFKKCHHWATCDNLVEALSSHLPQQKTMTEEELYEFLYPLFDREAEDDPNNKGFWRWKWVLKFTGDGLRGLSKALVGHLPQMDRQGLIEPKMKCRRCGYVGQDTTKWNGLCYQCYANENNIQ